MPTPLDASYANNRLGDCLSLPNAQRGNLCFLKPTFRCWVLALRRCTFPRTDTQEILTDLKWWVTPAHWALWDSRPSVSFHVDRSNWTAHQEGTQLLLSNGGGVISWAVLRTCFTIKRKCEPSQNDKGTVGRGSEPWSELIAREEARAQGTWSTGD